VGCALKRGAVGIIVAVISLGCSGGGGGADAANPGTGGSTGGAGVGGTGGSSSLDPTPFLGTWSETTTITVSGACANLIDPVTTTVPIAVTSGAPSSDPLPTETTEPSCAIPLNLVSGTQATLKSPKQCIYSSGSGSVTYNFSAWTMTVSGNTGTESASGTATLAGVGNCPVSMTATLSR